MESLWEQADRQKQREEMDLAAFLQMLEENQRGLRTAVRALEELDDSPKRRQAQRAAEEAQRKLGEEIGPLKEKIEATLSKAAQPAAAGAASGGAASPAPTALPEEIKQGIVQLQSLADEAARAIETAAARLHDGEFSEAHQGQTEAVEKFNQMYRGVAPYPSLVGRAVGAQQNLVNESHALANEKTADKSPDTQESAWNQDFVTRYSEVLVPLAREGLKQLESMPAARPAAAAPPQSGQNGSAPSDEKLQQQREGLKRSMEKAVELGPEVEKLAGEAAQLLHDQKPVNASPKQEEVLKLLKQIAEPLPKQDQQENQDKQDQNKRDEKQQDQKQSKQDQKQPDKKPREEESSRQQAETAVRRVQQRQQERQEMEKKMQRYQPRPGNVEKDW